ncbi:lachesin-like [Homarus americanus]|uniref:lachesin-like n=1 Tax=Homarus americanus TaxID=6706 RepID=UPI001C4646B2|nr:lachesin-like [Homarus americanus]
MKKINWKIVWFLPALVFVHTARSHNETMPRFGRHDHLEVQAAMGRDAVLTCTVHNIMHYQTAWLKMKKGIVIAMGDDVFTENPRITVHHSSPLDGGGGSSPSRMSTWTIQATICAPLILMPPKILDANTSSDLEVDEGEQVSLFCGASGKPEPSYRWRREDSRLIYASGKTELMVMGRELTIPHLLREHAGAYLCIASNGVLPSVSKRILLSVRFQPMIRATTAQVLVNLGSTVNLTCVVDAFPEPKMVWVRDFGDPITSHPGRGVYHLHQHTAREVQKYVHGVMYVNSSRWIMTLVVADVQEVDLFGYRCRANNTEGTAEARVALFSKFIKVPS